MAMNRRQFSLLVAAALVGCNRDPHEAADAGSKGPGGSKGLRVIDAGPVQGVTPGPSDAFASQGFFVVREGHEVFALSSRCTHRNCRVRAQSDGSFACKCHGSKFDARGKVLKGPASRDLPRLAVATDSRGHLLVNLDRSV